MRLRLTLTALAALLLSACGGGGSSPSAKVACADLTPSALDTSATGRITLSKTQLVAASGSMPEYCRVEGTMSPESGSSIGFAANVPTTAWNGRFLMLGNGGYAGGPLPAAGSDVAAGYATATTDTGHTATDASVFYNNRIAEIDYGYRAVHLTALVGKQITNRIVGTAPTYSYFNGCSTGGRQALMSAQRYPTDFDGIVAGSPALQLTGLAVEQNWSLRQFWQNNFAGNIYGKVNLLVNAVKTACADSEGVIENPGSCSFDPATLQCPAGTDSATCLTAAQVTAVKEVYRGPHSSNGTSWYPGKPVGSEASWASWLVADSSNPAKWFPLQGGFGFSFVGNLFFETDPPPTYQWTDFNFDTDPPKGAFMAAILNATNPDLSAFNAGHGKLLMYHGTADGLIGYQPTVQYYQNVQAQMGSDVTSSFARLFLVQGMDHCDFFDRGGLSVSDWMSPLVNWVEKGVAPGAISAKSRSANPISFTRPVCPWPKIAAYSGSGDRKDAANWSCK
jgi:pimeloyl-ACP methyl ester carboxylesterase